MYDYHLRQDIIAEAHARPLQSLEAPLALVHITVLFDGLNGKEVERDILRRIREAGYPVNTAHRGFLFSHHFDRAIRYEPHNEFYTLTFYRFNTTRILELSEEWRACLPGAFISGTEIILRKKARSFMMNRGAEGFSEWGSQHFTGTPKISSEVMDGAAAIVTDFKVQPDSGFIRFLIEDQGMRPGQLGRLVQRLCEIETYRSMALLSLPEARFLMPKLNELDQKLAWLSQRSIDDELAGVLSRMMALAGEVEALSAGTANRFAATDAYFALVERNLQELNEQRIGGRQMIREFVERHLEPARRTSRSAAVRIELLSKRIARATELIQSQVNLSIENQNKELLEALNSRDHRKVRLQAKLEGLSVIVIAYYVYDLIDLALKNLLREGDLLDNLLVGATLSLPFLIGVIWLIVRRLMNSLQDDR